MTQKKFLLAFALMFISTFASASPILAGYYPDWGKWEKPAYPVDKVPYEKFTHVLWSFISPNADGSLRGDAADDPSELDEMVKLAHAAGTKVVLSLGGAGLCENFATVAGNDALRTKFVTNLTEYVAKHDLDGLDMDWEYSQVPVPEADTVAYNKLIRDLRTALPKEKSLSAALPCSPYYGKYFTVSVLAEVLDWFGFMTYDITGDWDDKARFDSPLYPNTESDYTTWSWKETAEHWEKLGVPASKMVFGVPFFGFQFEGTNAPGTGFNGKATYMDYKEIMRIDGQTFAFDSVSMEPYAFTANTFTTLETPQSVGAKAKWILENNYAGAMIWDISQDVMDDYKQPLLDTLSAIFFEGQSTSNPQRIVTRGTSHSDAHRAKATVINGTRPTYIYDALGHSFIKEKAKKAYYGMKY